MTTRLFDLLWLILLAAYIFAIPPTFHGDEPMQIYASHDYVTAFIERNPAALMTSAPYEIDSDAHLRLINGSINRYAIGLSWHAAGLTANDLPPRPGWDWGLDYDTNVSTGHLPASALLAASRFSSALFLALSAAVMFALGWQFGGRVLAYFASALYTLNPIVLLNGRRALQEGSILFFGLLLVLIAVLISKRTQKPLSPPVLERGTRTPFARGEGLLWLALALVGGLTLASKHTGIVFVAGAFGWIFLAELLRLRWRALLITSFRLLLAAVLALALFVALSPALWNDPPARIANLLEERARLLDIQVQGQPTTLQQRVEGIITEPFVAPPQHFEVPFWANFQPVTDDIARYMASPFSGLQFGVVLGGLLTVFVGLGIVFSLRRNWRAGLLIWLLLTVASLLANPLPWQRYYLPLIPSVTLLAAVGLSGLLRFVRKPEQASASSDQTEQNG